MVSIQNITFAPGSSVRFCDNSSDAISLTIRDGQIVHFERAAKPEQTLFDKVMSGLEGAANARFGKGTAEAVAYTSAVQNIMAFSRGEPDDDIWLGKLKQSIRDAGWPAADGARFLSEMKLLRALDKNGSLAPEEIAECERIVAAFKAAQQV